MTVRTDIAAAPTRPDREAAIIGLPMVIGLVVVGLFAFAALVMLLSYSDELRPGEPATGSANDTSAVGYSGLQVLLEEMGHEVRVDPYPHQGRWDGRELRLYFPNGAFSEDRRERIDPDVPGLFVLPKWQVAAIEEGNPHVVRRSDPGLGYGAGRILETLEPGYHIRIAQQVQADWPIDIPGDIPRISYPRWVVPASEVEPDVTADVTPDDDTAQPPEATEETSDSEDETGAEAGSGADDFAEEIEKLVRGLARSKNMSLVEDVPRGDLDAVLPNMDSLRIRVLAEPDLLSNHGIATEPRARLAIGLLSETARGFGIEDPVFVFDDSLRRRDTSQNLVKLLTRPPFLAATLCLLAAGALVGWQGFNRFGDPVREGEDEPDSARRGPQALVETAADFIRGSGRIDALAPRYADVVRRQAVDALRLPVTDVARADAALARREAVREITPTLAQLRADTTLTPMARANALRRWKEEITR